MNETYDFAAQYPRDSDGLILFPRDTEARRGLFPEAVFHHPAKMWLFLTQEIVRKYSKPGDRILDPFGGTGTTAIGALEGREVWLVELEESFREVLEEMRDSWVKNGKVSPSQVILLFGDAKRVMEDLPEKFFNAVITSPPYANLLVGREKTEFTGGLARYKADARKYGASESSPLNLGRLNPWLFQQAMEKIYKEVARVLVPGGFYVSVTKDQMRAGERYRYSMDIVRIAQKSGLEYTGDWYKWKPPGGMLQSVMKSKGSEVVEDEDVIVFRRPQ